MMNFKYNLHRNFLLKNYNKTISDMREHVVLEMPFNLGLSQNDSDKIPGVDKLPNKLREYGFHQFINAREIISLTTPDYVSEVDKQSGVLNANKIASYADFQSHIILHHLSKDDFLIILGGDCSILIGNAAGLKMHGEYALFFIDGHTDFILPNYSKTKAAAGMDLAIVTGNGHPKLTNILNLGPYIKEENVYCVGNRNYDQVYVESIRNSAINYIDLETFRDRGAKDILNTFTNMVKTNKLDGIFIHFDVDVLDDEVMPLVDSRQKGGMNYKELASLIIPLLNHPLTVGIQITILDPELDDNGKYLIEFSDWLKEVFRKSKLMEVR